MSVHYINKTKVIKSSGFVTKIDKETGYTIACKEIDSKNDKGDDNPDCLCKIVIINGKRNPYIKSDIYGNLFNPWMSMTNQLEINRRIIKKNSAWSYKLVTQECFDIYMKFLKTRNANYHRMCERLVKNG